MLFFKLASRELFIISIFDCLLSVILALSDDDGELTTKNIYRNNLSGKELRVVVGHFPPSIAIIRNSTTGHVTGYSGSLYLHLLWLAQRLNFTFSLKPAQDNTNGMKINGTWTGILGELATGEVDLACAPLGISIQRYEAMEFCGYLDGTTTSILIQYPTFDIMSYFGILQTFSYQSWIGFFVSALALAITAFCLLRLREKLFNDDDITQTETAGFGILLLFIVGIFTGNGNSISAFVRKTIGLLAVIGFFLSFTFVNIYSSTLASYMSVTYKKPDINSFRDLATRTDYTATILKGSVAEIDIFESLSGDLEAVGDKIRQCAECRCNDLESMTRKVLDGDKTVAIMPTVIGRGMMGKYSSERNKCTLTMAHEELIWKPYYFGVPKDSPYIEEINRESLYYRESGLAQFERKKISKYPEQCTLNYNSKGVAVVVKDPHQTRIKLKQFTFAFLVLFIGSLIAFVQLLREKMHHHFHQLQQREREEQIVATALAEAIAAAVASTWFL